MRNTCITLTFIRPMIYTKAKKTYCVPVSVLSPQNYLACPRVAERGIIRKYSPQNYLTCLRVAEKGIIRKSQNYLTCPRVAERGIFRKYMLIYICFKSFRFGDRVLSL